jgi:hypothetical protein
MDGAESQALMVPEPATPPAVMGDFDEAGVDIDEEEYGEIIERTEESNKSLLGDINTEGRPRSSLLTSASFLPYHIPRFRDWYPRVPIQYRAAFTYGRSR